MEFKIIKLDLDDNRTIEKFYDFYVNVFEKCFLKDEIGPFEAYLSIKRAENSAYSYHLNMFFRSKYDKIRKSYDSDKVY